MLGSVATEDGPKRNPKPATCVAYADLQANAAAEPGRTAADRDQRRDQARRAYQQALKTDPNYQPAYAGLGSLYEAVGDHERAVSTFRKGLEIHPKDSDLWFQLGMCQARHHEWQDAEASLQKAREFEPDNHRYVNMLGYCQARVGHYEASVATFRSIVSEAQARCNVARMLHHNGQNEVAKEQAELALKLQPDLDSAKRLLDEIAHGKQDGSASIIGLEGLDDLPAPHAGPVGALGSK